jgi:hypothetical protein
MAYGVAEDPALSLSAHLDGVEYPVVRDALARIAADNGAPVDIINVLKSLPRHSYDSREAVMRDLAEAARRFAIGNVGYEGDGVRRDRRNIGKDLVEEAPEGHTRHP